MISFSGNIHLILLKNDNRNSIFVFCGNAKMIKLKVMIWWRKSILSSIYISCSSRSTRTYSWSISRIRRARCEKSEVQAQADGVQRRRVKYKIKLKQHKKARCGFMKVEQGSGSSLSSRKLIRKSNKARTHANQGYAQASELQRRTVKHKHKQTKHGEQE